MFVNIFLFFCDTQKHLANIPYGVTSGNFSFIFDHPIICKTFEYINKSNNSYEHVHSVNTSKFGRLIIDYFVEHMTPDIHVR